MAIYEHVTEFMGLPVEDWDPDKGLVAPAGTMVRIAVDYDDEEDWTKKSPPSSKTRNPGNSPALAVGMWSGNAGEAPDAVVEALVAARDNLPDLRAIFFGDVTMEECEISWINQTDLSPLLEGFPRLENWRIRGGQGCRSVAPRHDALRTLIFQTGGLPAEVVHSVGAADLPALERLELWLGSDNHGGDHDGRRWLAPRFLRGDRFPRLRYLGLKDSEFSDDIAAAMALARVLGPAGGAGPVHGHARRRGGGGAVEQPGRADAEETRHPPPLLLGRGGRAAPGAGDRGRRQRPAGRGPAGRPVHRGQRVARIVVQASSLARRSGPAGMVAFPAAAMASGELREGEAPAEPGSPEPGSRAAKRGSPGGSPGSPSRSRATADRQMR